MNQIETVRAHWSEIGTVGRLPERRLVRPDALGAALSWAFLLKPRNGELVFQIAGARICESFGLDLRDLPFLKIWSPEDAPVIDRSLADAIAQAKELALHSDTRSVRGRVGRLEMTCCPVRQGGGGVGFLGAMALEPSLPPGLDRVEAVKIAPEQSTGSDRSIARALASIARRRGDRSRRDLAPRLREAGGRPTLHVV